MTGPSGPTGPARCVPCEIEEVSSPILRAIARAAWRYETRRQERHPLTGMARSMAAIMGNPPREIPHHERHRSEYIRTGDQRELARSLRILGEQEGQQ